MAGLEKILSEINLEAEANAERILDAAKKEAAEITGAAEKEASNEAARYERESAKRAQDRKQRASSAAALKKRQLLLARKQELISEVLDKAKDKLISLPEAEYFGALLKLMEKNALPQKGMVLLSSKDTKRLPADFASKVESAGIKAGGRLSLSKEVALIDGGFILRYPGIEQNCSVTALFETNAEELQDEIRKLLF